MTRTVIWVETGGRRRARWLLLATGVSILGDRFGELALPVVSLEVTHSALDTAAVSATIGFPGLLVALVVARRISSGRSRAVVASANILQALAFAALGLLVAEMHASLTVLLVFALAVGVGAAVAGASMPTVVRESLDDRRLQRFNGLVEVVDGAATLAGPILAGFALSTLGAPSALGVDAVSFAVAGVILLSALRARADRPETARPVPATPGGVVAYLLGDSEQRLLLAAAVATNMQSGGVVLGVVLLSRRALLASPLQTGGILAAAGVGAIISGAVIVPRVRIERWQAAVTASFSVSAVALAALAAAPSVPVAAVANILVDAASVVCFALTGTRRLQAAPAALLPHLSAITYQTASAAAVGGVVLVGALASTFGPRWGLAGLAVVAVLAAAVLAVSRAADLPQQGPGLGP